MSKVTFFIQYIFIFNILFYSYHVLLLVKRGKSNLYVSCKKLHVFVMAGDHIEFFSGVNCFTIDPMRKY